jgi:hypothetical protein
VCLNLLFFFFTTHPFFFLFHTSLPGKCHISIFFFLPTLFSHILSSYLFLFIYFLFFLLHSYFSHLLTLLLLLLLAFSFVFFSLSPLIFLPPFFFSFECMWQQPKDDEKNECLHVCVCAYVCKYLNVCVWKEEE